MIIPLTNGNVKEKKRNWVLLILGIHQFWVSFFNR